MSKLSRSVWELSAFAVIVVMLIIGVFAPAENAVRDLRFKYSSRVPTGDIVFVAIDPLSLQQVGVWPWPRMMHAYVINKLLALNAADIFVDIDFSSTSTETNDASLERALRNAGGFAGLAAFAQKASIGSDIMTVNLPLERFRAQSEVVVVNVAAEADGDVRTYPYGAILDGELYPSVATYLTGGEPNEQSFLIDFSIDASLVDTISVSDLLNGTVDPARIADKQIVIGASALELRDTLTVPRFGNIPGPLLQILSAETVKQNRELIQPGLWVSVLLLVVLFAILMFGRRFKSLGFALGAGLVYCVITEIAAFGLQSEAGLLLNNFVCHVGLAAFALAASAQELDVRMLMLKRTAQEREITQNILNRVIADNFDGVVVVGQSGKILAASRFAEGFFGFTADGDQLQLDEVLPSVLSSEVRSAFSRGVKRGAEAVREVDLNNDSNRLRTIEYVVTLSAPAEDQESSVHSEVACLTFRDVTERKASERRLRYFADHDPLTGTLSRRRFVEMISESAEIEGPGGEFSVYLVNLSRFKGVNETLGHDYGDEVLKQAANRLKSLSSQVVARMGGDGFAILKLGVANEEDAAKFCDRIISAMSKTYILGEHHAILGARVGVSCSAISGTDAEILIAHADMALSEAKQKHISSAAFYRPEMSVKLNATRTMEIALNSALASKQFFLQYQPQVALKNENFLGAEALVRWQHPELGRVSPADFISLAEETGLILQIGKWVLVEACREAVKWPEHTSIAVNFSPMQFAYGDVLKEVKDALRITGLAAERLVVEITESLLISDTDAVIETLNQLRAIKVRIALDDFGTGFSSMSYLERLPIDKIKIDQAFVRGLPENRHSIAVIQAVMTLSQSSDRLVVAEGIETKEQAEMLKAAGCQIGQGYYFGKPMEGVDIRERYFATNKPDAHKKAG